ncbi:putative signal peptide protein [Puccinia sorghi]|uniref:Putative signal peptide protein n=1 Tax=Puccinia sorghi TaxID=27349 RepID=A0A0L6VH19_9BASI|nr:putative signal peptide protein [Puccinia sorghi]
MALSLPAHNFCLIFLPAFVLQNVSNVRLISSSSLIDQTAGRDMKENRNGCVQKKLAQPPAVDMQKFPRSFCCYSNLSPRLFQPIFEAQSLCRLHSDCAKKLTYASGFSQKTLRTLRTSILGVVQPIPNLTSLIRPQIIYIKLKIFSHIFQMLMSLGEIIQKICVYTHFLQTFGPLGAPIQNLCAPQVVSSIWPKTHFGPFALCQIPFQNMPGDMQLNCVLIRPYSLLLKILCHCPLFIGDFLKWLSLIIESAVVQFSHAQAPLKLAQQRLINAWLASSTIHFSIIFPRLMGRSIFVLQPGLSWHEGGMGWVFLFEGSELRVLEVEFSALCDALKIQYVCVCCIDPDTLIRKLVHPQGANMVNVEGLERWVEDIISLSTNLEE